MAAEDRNTPTEFGGGPGLPQRLPDGTSKGLRPGEEARVLRQIGNRDVDPGANPVVGRGADSGLTEREKALYAEDIRRTRVRAEEQARLARDTNDYDKEVL
jgi:hypothetical protein